MIPTLEVNSNFKVDRKWNRKPGYARYTERGNEAEFIELKQPSDEVELQQKDFQSNLL